MTDAISSKTGLEKKKRTMLVKDMRTQEYKWEGLFAFQQEQCR